MVDSAVGAEEEGGDGVTQSSARVPQVLITSQVADDMEHAYLANAHALEACRGRGGRPHALFGSMAVRAGPHADLADVVMAEPSQGVSHRGGGRQEGERGLAEGEISHDVREEANGHIQREARSRAEQRRKEQNRTEQSRAETSDQREIDMHVCV